MEKRKRNLVIITGVSCSGKTTLQNKMIENGWSRPINFTTRKPRNDDELDEYVFLDKQTYGKKLINGDFLESTNYGGNWYSVSKHLSDGDVCIILDPLGRQQIIQKIVNGELNGFNVVYVFLHITEEEQEKRLVARKTLPQEAKRRKKDFEWFYPINAWMELKFDEYFFDGTQPTDVIYNKLIGVLKKT